MLRRTETREEPGGGELALEGRGGVHPERIRGGLHWAKAHGLRALQFKKDASFEADLSCR